MNKKMDLKKICVLSTIGTATLIANPFQCFADNKVIQVISTYDAFQATEAVPSDDSDFGMYDPYGYDNSESDYDDSDSNYCNEDESDVETSEEEELGTMPDIHGIIEKYNLQELHEVADEWYSQMQGLMDDVNNMDSSVWTIRLWYNDYDKCYEGLDEAYDDQYTYLGYDLVNNKPEGEGLIYYGDVLTTWQDESFARKTVAKYIGKLKEGKPEGVGFESFCSNIYGIVDLTTEFAFGEYEDGLLNGIGMYITGEGDSQMFLCGEFVDGVAEGEVAIYSHKGKLFEGTMENGVKYGEGKEYYENGNLKYEGEFKDGVYDGEGTLYDKYGDETFSGTWEEGVAIF